MNDVGQVLQIPLVVLLEYVPASHATQEVEPAVEVWPAEQVTHCVKDWNVPLGQIWQLHAPTALM